MNRNKAASLAQETVTITGQGYYRPAGGHRVDITASVTASKQGTVLYDAAAGLPVLPTPRAESCRIEVTPETTYQAMARLAAGGAHSIGCLNFASAKNPGGGFLNGARAQEEALCRSSALYAALLCAPDYYARNRACGTCIYLDLAIISPGVPFFRDDGGDLLGKPLCATVITSPAPNAGAVLNNETENAPFILPALTRRAALVLHAAALHGVENFVLGAWGCGVFRNDPAHVARVFADLLTGSAPFARAFRHVVFAVFDPGESKPNYTAFRNIFAQGV